MNPLEVELPLEEGLVLLLEEGLPSPVSVEELLLVALFVELPASIVILFIYDNIK